MTICYKVFRLQFSNNIFKALLLSLKNIENDTARCNCTSFKDYILCLN